MTEEPSPAAPTVDDDPVPEAATDATFEELETRFDAQLGVFAVDTGSGAEIAWRGEERFAYASTIKAMAAAALLERSGVGGLEAEVSIDADDLVPHSPVTEEHAGGTLTLAELASAAMTVSDNTAANYLFEALGGPDGLQTALEEVGDEDTVVSRWEPDLNEAAPGDDRDTTTPRAMASNLREYVLGETLSPAEQELLTDWLTGTETGDTLIRARLPAGWTVGDRSGGGGYGTRNDIGVLWPADDSAPIVVSVFSRRDEPDAEYDDALIAEAAEAVVAELR